MGPSGIVASRLYGNELAGEAENAPFEQKSVVRREFAWCS